MGTLYIWLLWLSLFASCIHIVDILLYYMNIPSSDHPATGKPAGMSAGTGDELGVSWPMLRVFLILPD